MVIDITGDIKDSTKYIYGSIVNTGLPKEIWQTTNSLCKDAYLEYLKKIVVLNGTSSLESESIINSVATVMQDIASVSLSIEKSRDPSKISNYKTLNEFSVLINNVL